MCAGTFDGSIIVWELVSHSVVARIRVTGPQIVATKASFSPDGTRLAVSADHVRREADRVSHFVYDGRAGAIVGGLTTTRDGYGHHARSIFSSDGGVLYINDGAKLIEASTKA